MKGLFGDNIRDAVKAIKGTGRKQPHKVEFPMCEHPELIPTMWDQPKPKPARSIGSCPVHNHTCPVCGHGVESAPECDCPERRY